MNLSRNLLPVLLLSIRYSQIFTFGIYYFFAGKVGGGGGVGCGGWGGRWSILKSSSILKTLSYFCSRQDYRRTAGLRWRRYVRELLTGSQTFASQLLGGIVRISDPNLGPCIKKCLVYDEEKEAILQAHGLINIQNSEWGKMLR